MAHSQTYTQQYHSNMDRLYQHSIQTGNQRHSPKVTDHSWNQFNGTTGRHTTSSATSLSQHVVSSTAINNKNNSSPTVYPPFLSPSYDVQQHSMNLSQHIYQRGLLESIGSDVIVKIPAWQGEYHLHRLILDQNPYFQTLFQGGFLETSTSEITLHFEKHSYITADSFQFVLTQLYGKVGDPDINLTNVQPILATCSFFQLDSMCELCVEFILQSLSEYTVVDYLLFADSHLVFGSDKVCDAIFTFLCREAYGMDPKRLVGIPAAWFKKITHSDSFWVPSEYHRYQFIENVIQQKYSLWFQQKQHSINNNVALQSQNPHSMDFLDYSYQDDDILLTNEDDYQHLQNTSESESELSTTSSSAESSTETNKRNHSASLRRHNELTDSLKAFDDILSHSIHYIHMTFEQLNAIRQDINPFNNRPMVSDSIIKDALWNQIQIRAKIESAMEDKKVLDMTTADPSSLSSTTNNSYAIPTNDITTYTGESALLHVTTPTSMLSYRNHLLHHSPPSTSPSTSTSPSSQEHHRKSTSSSPVSISTTPETLQYAQHPPFRFSVEFKDVANLKRNVRVYSKTVFYAGSNWNMYIQKTKSQRKGKGVLQLGVYLHRQSIPSENDHSSSQKNPATSQNCHSGNNLADQSSSFSQYVDNRLVTKTWFKIFCPSRGPKHTLTLFQSSPDDFSVLQSWGWRSTVLCADETNNNNNNHSATTTATGLGAPTSSKAAPANGAQVRNNTFDTSSSSHYLDTSITNPPPPPPLINTHMANLSLSSSTFDNRTQSNSPDTMLQGQDVDQQLYSNVNPMMSSSIGSTLRFSVVMGHV
ncbi:hypothetical protein BCR42DRAFT_495274 [Absidia repens]|uniref:BTB domain-containing protein n=1 Tax=Absidia repens TaxID=90262 RepID=A0A1X2I4I5_9FUNG|nr:hypothetical protein BCR42DRAFT_495274 [Absidia repens]